MDTPKIEDLVQKMPVRPSDDTYRRHIVPQAPEDLLLVAQIKQKCEELRNIVDMTSGDPRSRAIALTKLEEVAMWATKAATQ